VHGAVFLWVRRRQFCRVYIRLRVLNRRRLWLGGLRLRDGDGLFWHCSYLGTKANFAPATSGTVAQICQLTVLTSRGWDARIWIASRPARPFRARLKPLVARWCLIVFAANIFVGGTFALALQTFGRFQLRLRQPGRPAICPCRRDPFSLPALSSYRFPAYRLVIFRHEHNVTDITDESVLFGWRRRTMLYPPAATRALGILRGHQCISDRGGFTLWSSSGQSSCTIKYSSSGPVTISASAMKSWIP
jgi:hypothetical protein